MTKLTDDSTDKFLQYLRKNANVSLAAKAIGISRQALYKARAENKEFANAWDDAIQEATDRLLQAAWNRATKGVKKPVYFQGVQCGEVKEYSDSLLTLLLKSYRPEQFSEKLKAEVTGKDGAAIQLQNLSTEQLLDRLNSILERARQRRDKANSESGSSSTS